MTTTPQSPAPPERLQIDVHFVDLEILTTILDAVLGELKPRAEAPAQATQLAETECCSPEEQSICCEPEDKAECCGAAAAGEPCGCR